MVDILGPAYLPPSVCTQPNLAVALSWVVSRSLRGRVSYELGALWPYLRADGPPGDSELIMLPLFDMLNHSVDVGRTTCTTLRAASHALALQAPCLRLPRVHLSEVGLVPPQSVLPPDQGPALAAVQQFYSEQTPGPLFSPADLGTNYP